MSIPFRSKDRKASRRKLDLSVIAGVLLLGACAAPPQTPSTQHLDPAPAVAGKAPDFSPAPAIPKPPKPVSKPELYSVVVHDIEIKDLLFALARDAKLNVDIHPGISGTISMNAVDQSLTEILDRIAKQSDIRYELNGKLLSISPDTPFLKIYRIDYPNVSRDAKGTIGTSVTVTSAGVTGEGSGSGSNSSSTTVENVANNRFWETLTKNLQDLLHETDKVFPDSSSGASTGQTSPTTTPTTTATVPSATTTSSATAALTAIAANNTASAGGAPAGAPASGGSASTKAASASSNSSSSTGNAQQSVSAPVSTPTYREAASVIVNAENGVVNVRATQRQHDRVREFIDRVMNSARRQVLIEATIVEVDLSERFQQGIDWSLLRTSGTPTGTGFRVNANALGATGDTLTGGIVTSPSSLIINNAGWGAYTLSMALRLLESFGTLRVLSSPKISVLNNQTSVLKVVDNEVYFSLTVTPGTPATATSAATPAIYTTSINTVPVGFLMTVIPQISENGEVILNLRPTITRISRYVTDPNPALPSNSTAPNRVPIIQLREMESIMRVQSGDIAVLGGLIQDRRTGSTDELGGPISSIPVVGELFKFKDTRNQKIELVIFLRPVVLSDPSIDGDFKHFRTALPQARRNFPDLSGKDRWVDPIKQP